MRKKINSQISFKNQVSLRVSFLEKTFRVCLIFGFLFFFNFSFVLAEESIEEIKDNIEKVDEKLEKEKKKETSILEDLKKIEENISQIKKALTETEQKLNQYDEEIKSSDRKISEIEKRILEKKENLADYLRIFRQVEKEKILILMNVQEDIGSYLRFLEDYEKVQEKIKMQLGEIDSEKKQEELERQIVSDKREEQQKVYWMQNDQKGDLEFEERKKQLFLNKTQKDINTLSEERLELRKQLNALQSLGKAIGLDEAIEIAKKVSQKTKVRTAFLLGVLRVESNMGQNVGGGTYKTDMNPALHDTFKDICEELGLDPKKMPVSRRVCYNYNKKAKDGCGGWGGAMGPAQFMPSTWLVYKDRVAKMTGNNPPNPWDLEDALTAMGIKLAGVSGVTSGKESAEKKAAAMYLAGEAWESYSWYGDRVLYYADSFEKYMKD